MKLAFFEVDELSKKFFTEAFQGQELLFFEDTIFDTVPLQARDAEVISTFVCSSINTKILSQFSSLKLIAHRATGYDSIDLKAASSYGVKVCNVPHYAEQTVAEYTLALMLCLSRKIYEAYYRVEHEHYFSHKNLQGFDLQGKTLGVVGTGNIGRRVIALAQAFGMDIIAYDAFPDYDYAKKMKFLYCSFEDLLQQSDIITFHVPFIAKTYHMINKKNIMFLKKGSYIINTARGGIVQTEALVEALDKNIIAGAALDVLEEECFTKDPLSLLVDDHPEKKELKAVLENHYLIKHPKVIITPHNAFNSYEALERLLKKTVENIKNWQVGNPINIVNN